MTKLNFFILRKSAVFTLVAILLLGCSDRTNPVVSDGNLSDELPYSINNFQPPKNFVAIYEPEMVLVEAGTFIMGCPPEHEDDCHEAWKPAHEVTLTNNYYIGKYQVTQKLWRLVMMGTELEDPSAFKGDNLPIESVSWDDIVNEFLPKLNALAGKEYRLPTEAEWEFAARGGNESKGYKYSGSDDPDEVATYTNGQIFYPNPTTVVGSLKANELGIHDMSGNVLEWVNDKYSRYTADPKTNPAGAEISSQRISRGGAWSNAYEDALRVYARVSTISNHQSSTYGFRLAISPSTNSIKERPREIPQR